MYLNFSSEFLLLGSNLQWPHVDFGKMLLNTLLKNKTFVVYSLSFMPLKEQEELWKVYIDITFDVMAEFSSAFCINTEHDRRTFFVFRTRPV